VQVSEPKEPTKSAKERAERQKDFFARTSLIVKSTLKDGLTRVQRRQVEKDAKAQARTNHRAQVAMSKAMRSVNRPGAEPTQADYNREMRRAEAQRRRAEQQQERIAAGTDRATNRLLQVKQ
jgi:hypothetical protein